MAFVKIHGVILRSSIWTLPLHVRIVWITMLALADADGIVEASVGGLAIQAQVTREQCQEAVDLFLGPDPDSRDGTTGERIEAVPGGWLVLNHAEYRDRQTRAQRLAADRAKKHRDKRRELKAADVTNHARHDLSLSEAEAEADTEAEKKKSTRKPKPSMEGFDEFWAAYDKKRSRVTAEKAWRKVAPDAELRGVICWQAENYANATPDKQYRKDPATWLNQRCWEDEIVTKETYPPGDPRRCGKPGEFGDMDAAMRGEF